MKTPKQQAYQFFYKHAGYSYDPKTETRQAGRAKCARELAKAERDARALGYDFVWQDDINGCSGCDCGDESCDCFTGESHEVLGCVAYDADGNDQASLWGICKPSREYRRVIEAELASEALAAV